MIRALCIAALLTSASCVSPAGDAPAASAAAEPTPVWRMDLSHLEADRATLEACFGTTDLDVELAEMRCARAVEATCLVEIGEDAAMTPVGSRGCSWRSLAAWEEVLEQAAADLRGVLSAEELSAFEAAQAAWAAFLIANVRSRSSIYAGGSLEGVVAADVRARMTAERAVELRDYRRMHDL